MIKYTMEKNNESRASTSANTDADKDPDAPESKSRRLMEKDDSGISVEKSGNSSEDDQRKSQASSEGNSAVPDLFPKMRSHSKTRNYRKSTHNTSDTSSDDGEEVPPVEEQDRPESPMLDYGDTLWPNLDDVLNSSSSSSMESPPRRNIKFSDTEENGDDDDEPTPAVLLKQKPKHKWSMVHEIINRQQGVSSHKLGPELMHARFYGSLHAVQRLELMYKLNNHNGCVNALNFNSSGTKLASTSDDLQVIVWDWVRGQQLFDFESGHSNNVFQAKFMPLCGDTHIVTCARDGQVRLAVLSTTGKCTATRRLAQHSQSAHKLAVQQDVPHVVLSAGEDSQILSIDLREPKANRLMYVKEGAKKIALYSISSNPLDYNEFVVGGRDQYVRIYDKRKISAGKPMKKFCPHHLLSGNHFTHVTCAVFNHDGSEVVASFNDDDIFLFDTRHSDGADFVHKYEGHRNSATVKGVNFFGPHSEFVVSGSDCGNVFFWDKHTESIVQWINADENGVVNCLEPHPHIPVIATSGLDYDVKIWVPSYEQEPAMAGLKSAVISNLKNREEELRGEHSSMDGQMLYLLWRQIRRTTEHDR
ncbi:hypothetical protein B566_EDAN001285, partial [Ephemera danica]